MARSRKVEPEAAVQAAKALFWKHGYGDLGTRQIEQETGITRFTLQTTYGGKMPLFLKTLDAYLDEFESFALPDPSRDDLEGLAAWFEARTDPAMMPEISSYGCLMLNSTVEFSASDAEVTRRAERYFSILRDGFRAALGFARESGTLDPAFDVAGKTEVLLGATLGLNIIIRSAADNAAGQDMSAAIARMVRGWMLRPRSD